MGIHPRPCGAAAPMDYSAYEDRKRANLSFMLYNVKLVLRVLFFMEGGFYLWEDL